MGKATPYKLEGYHTSHLRSWPKYTPEKVQILWRHATLNLYYWITLNSLGNWPCWLIAFGLEIVVVAQRISSSLCSTLQLGIGMAWFLLGHFIKHVLGMGIIQLLLKHILSNLNNLIQIIFKNVSCNLSEWLKFKNLSFIKKFSIYV